MPSASAQPAPHSERAPGYVHAPETPAAVEPRTAPELDGSNFPDGVLALTWDDGPDRHTLELARYLRRERVSGTFFVVRNWSRAVSSYPGYGGAVERTGYARIPILQELVRLGHRVGNHTQHHVFLDRVDAAHAQSELGSEQQTLAPFESDELGLFRVPGGAWNRKIAEEENAAPGLAGLVGPVRWDVDRKDWESSMRCDSARPESECEAWQGGRRLKATVTASRYLESISKARHGIVLLHDRVADVGSHYALDVARTLVPALLQRGFVFAAPLLAFSPLSDRLTANARSALPASDLENSTFVDGNNDGRADLCARGATAWTCLLSSESHGTTADGLPKSMFGVAIRLHRDPALLGHNAPECKRRWGAGARLADVDGDGYVDCCKSTRDGISCARGHASTFDEPALWSSDSAFRGESTGRTVFLLGDLNGDLRADTCSFHAGLVTCALSTGSAFTSATVWARPGMLLTDARLRLVDINGDARADLCILEKGRVSCGVAP